MVRRLSASRAMSAMGGMGALAGLLLAASACAVEPACPPGALGTARVLTLPRAAAAYGTLQHDPLPLAEGELVLSFDDGPEPGATEAVLAALAAQCVRASFLVTGQQLERAPALARRLRDEGHSVGLHSHAHQPPDTLSPAQQLADLRRAQALFEQVYGQPARFWRYPFLAETDTLRAALAAERITVLSADLGIEDWVPAGSTEALAARLTQALATQRRGIVLLHDAQRQTAQALPALLALLQRQGFRIVHLRWQDAP
ncbi:polysaccharide deacetylase family protein [Ideonella alba]|uniref:Polysaccharide deacetylase family protein n=1 Tax=Ideonella alba TaxID=2824118 RepID=A0A941BF04_9BURK|nr:polysaccharide deacetylase family protein [Ideonella alba]MBQ0928893.1 polysaccharide deacetylase family protein [Ideonella alba]